MGKVSFICTTYRRFSCVERIVAQYLAQSYQNKELIIFNTDERHPYRLGFVDDSIFIVNNGVDYLNGEAYRNRGQICRDAVTHATGDYFMLADDDDIYLPWHIEQAVDGIIKNGMDSWKPSSSFFASPGKLELCRNTMEASVIVKMNRIREIGFRSDLTGYEGLSWYTRLRDEGQLDENNDRFVPSYCFNWSDPQEMAGHKQSGDINNPDNFENHKRASMDFAKVPLSNQYELSGVYEAYYKFIRDNINMFQPEFIERYALEYL